MRLDRSITLNLVRPLRRLRSGVASAVPSDSSTPPLHHSILAIPVLMYHSISDDPETGVSPYYQTTTSPAMFRQHMQLLADLGYRTITISQLSAILQSSDNPQPTTLNQQPSAVITFDDGFRNFYTAAFPVLREHGFTATMFLPTAFIGETPMTFRPASGSGVTGPCLTWSEVTELAQAGIEFGSHTVNHPTLVELGWPEIKKELYESKSVIEQRLGRKINSFCHPYAFPQANTSFTTRLKDLLAEAGYSSCCTTQLGRVRKTDDPFRIKRLPANSQDDPALLGTQRAAEPRVPVARQPDRLDSLERHRPAARRDHAHDRL